MQAIDLGGSIQMFERVGSHFFVLATEFRRRFCGAARHRHRFAYAVAKPSRRSTYPHVGERTRQIAMFRVAFTVFVNSVGEMPQRQVITAFAAVHAPVTRLNIAAGDEVVRLVKYRIRFGE